MALGRAVAVVGVVDARLCARLRTQRVEGRRDVAVRAARRLEVVAEVRGEGVALRERRGAGVLLVRALALLLFLLLGLGSIAAAACSGGALPGLLSSG